MYNENDDFLDVIKHPEGEDYQIDDNDEIYFPKDEEQDYFDKDDELYYLKSDKPDDDSEFMEYTMDYEEQDRGMSR